MRSFFTKSMFVLALLASFMLLVPGAYASALEQTDNVTTLTFGETVNDTLATPVAVNNYSFTLTADGYVEVQFTAPQGGEYQLTVLRDDKLFCWSSADAPAKLGLAAGEYRLKIAPIVYSAEQYSLRADFTASNAWETELNDGRTSADALPAQGGINGNLFNADDVDCYTFSLSDSGNVSLKFTTTASLSRAGWNLTVLDSDSHEVIYSALSGSASTAPVTLDAGDYLVELTAAIHSDADYLLELVASDAIIVTRLNGNTRVYTAIEISKEGWAAGTCSSVVLANAYNYPDALAGVPLAYALDAPILLTPDDVLDPAVVTEIKRLGAKNVYILGGTAVISNNIENTLKNLGKSVKRIYGNSRFDTAVKIAQEIGTLNGTASDVFFVYSNNYADALSISSVAAIKGAPVLYIAADGELTDSVKNYLNSAAIKTATILGGSGAISFSAESNIRTAGVSSVSRIYGDTRFETCIKINESFASVLSSDHICVATGLNFPDALAGGVISAKLHAPLLLVPAELSTLQTDYISARSPSEVYIFGGTGVVSDAVAKAIAQL